MSLSSSGLTGRDRGAADSGSGRRWWPGTGLAVAVMTGLIIGLLGVLTGQVQGIAAAVPLLLGSAWAWQRRPDAYGSVRLSGTTDRGSRSPVAATLDWEPADRVDALRIRASAPGHRAAEAVLASARAARSVEIGIDTARTGRRPIFTVDHAERYAEGLFVLPGSTLGPAPVTVLPRPIALREVPLPFRLQGLTGPHDSRRAGDGIDLRDINLFAPGDRLRRIDWRVTARQNSGGYGSTMITDLYVRRSYATADAAVMLVLDSRDEVGPDISTWNDSSSIAETDPTSLDHARAAAATFARRYLQAGDRVGLEDLGRLRRPVPPSGGQRQLQRLIMRIALAEPEGEPRQRQRAPRLPSGALIIVCSTFLDDETGRLAQLWRAAGHRVIAVDVLPEPDLRFASDRLITAYRIIAMDREDRLAELTRSGIEVISWVSADDHPLQGSSHGGRPGGGRNRRQRPHGRNSVPVAMAALSRRRVRR